MAAPGRQRIGQQPPNVPCRRCFVGGGVVHPLDGLIDRQLQVVGVGDRYVQRIAHQIDHASGTRRRKPRPADGAPIGFVRLGEVRLALVVAGTASGWPCGERPGQQFAEGGQVLFELVRPQIRRVDPN